MSVYGLLLFHHHKVTGKKFFAYMKEEKEIFNAAKD